MNPRIVYTKSRLILLLIIFCSCSTRKQSTPLTFSRLQNAPITTDRASTGGVSWIDFDNDGDLDLAVTNGYDVSNPNGADPQKNKLYLNNGDGTFTSITNSPFATDDGFSSGSTWGDYDNDGDSDAFISNQRNQSNFLYNNDENGTLTAAINNVVTSHGGSSFSASWVDVDADGWLDLYVGNGGLSALQPDFLYRNNGDGTFEQIVDGPIVSDSLATTGGIWNDFDNDNDQDLFVTNAGGGDVLYLNEGNWNFTKVTNFSLVREMTIFQSHGATSGDFDNDGDIDIFINKTSGGSNLLLINDGSGNFTPLTNDPIVINSGYTGGSHASDFDNDGDLDIIAASWGGAIEYYENQGNMSFKQTVPGDLGTFINYIGGISSADYDKDGDVDLYIGNWPNFPGEPEENHFYVNQGTENNWLKIKLEGTKSNRSAIGAKVYVTANINGEPVTQLRQVSAHQNWRSQSGLIQHFGMGNSKVADKIVIKWPSGSTSEFKNVDLNAVFYAKEGS